MDIYIFYRVPIGIVLYMISQHPNMPSLLQKQCINRLMSVYPISCKTP